MSVSAGVPSVGTRIFSPISLNATTALALIPTGPSVVAVVMIAIAIGSCVWRVDVVDVVAIVGASRIRRIHVVIMRSQFSDGQHMPRFTSCVRKIVGVAGERTNADDYAACPVRQWRPTRRTRRQIERHDRAGRHGGRLIASDRRSVPPAPLPICGRSNLWIGLNTNSTGRAGPLPARAVVGQHIAGNRRHAVVNIGEGLEAGINGERAKHGAPICAVAVLIDFRRVVVRDLFFFGRRVRAIGAGFV